MNKLLENEKFEKYYFFLVSENEKYNLTAITQKEDVYNKHFYDSICMSKVIDMSKQIMICDIGSGAGFPGVPLKICYPQINLTLIEPTLKRVKFLKELQNVVNTDYEIIANRAEDIVNEYRNHFDVVTARAVASLPILLELLVGFVKVNGYVVLYKGDKGYDEIKGSENALKVLGCVIEHVEEYDLKNNAGKRLLIKIKKVKDVGIKYPRKYSEIKKKPL